MNLYQVLGVTRSATIDEIKKAYRKLALENHPDHNPDNSECEVRFKEITNAYEIIGDIHKRSEYDVKGYVGRRPVNSPSPPPQKPKPAPKPEPATEQPHDLPILNCTYFGSSQGGRNIMAHLKVSNYELRNGTRTVARIKKREICDRCVGDGNCQVACPTCTGVRFSDGGFGAGDSPHLKNLRLHCSKCDGHGIYFNTCPVCKGAGVAQWVVKNVYVTIPPNSQIGQQIMVAGEGESSPNKPPGYLQIVLIPQ